MTNDQPHRAPDDEPSSRLLLAGGCRLRLGALIHDGPLGPLHQAADLEGEAPALVRLVPARHFPAQALRERALREARRAAGLGLPGIAPLLGSGSSEARGLILAHAAPGPEPGETLEGLLRRRGPLPREEARLILGRAGRAVCAARGAGILHRNLAPGSIWVAGEDLLVLDFGLCECHEIGLRLVQGPQGFLAPEQEQGRDLAEPALVYGLGALYHYLLTGAPPQAEHPQPGLPADLAQLLRLLLDPDPDRRPATLAQALELAACEPAALHLRPTMVLPWPRAPLRPRL
jgi:serine/threonine-protein kinase